MPTTNLPENIKPGSITEMVYRLSSEHPELKAKEIHERVITKFPSCAITTVHAIRSAYRLVDKTRSAAVLKAVQRKAKGIKRAHKKKAAAKPAPTNGHSKPAAPAEDVTHEFRRLVARIGTDAAERLLATAKQV